MVPHRKWRKAKKKGEWKVGLKINFQKTKIMASGPISSWEIDGETVETVADFIFLSSKIKIKNGWWLQPWNEKTHIPWK